MDDCGSARHSTRFGPAPRWGLRRQGTVNWPDEHRRVYEDLAERSGLSLSEYVVRFMAARHGLLSQPFSPAGPDGVPAAAAGPAPEGDGRVDPNQLALGA